MLCSRNKIKINFSYTNKCCIILTEEAMRRWVTWSDKGMDGQAVVCIEYSVDTKRCFHTIIVRGTQFHLMRNARKTSHLHLVRFTFTLHYRK